MIKWLLLMPLVWLIDYIYGIMYPDFREMYINFEENIHN